MPKNPASPQSTVPEAIPSTTRSADSRGKVIDTRDASRKSGPGVSVAANHSRAMAARMWRYSAMKAAFSSRRDATKWDDWLRRDETAFDCRKFFTQIKVD